MHTVHSIAEFLERFAPPALAEDWDNVGLLVGDASRTVRRVMTCLTITPATASEAVDERADLIVTHHPLPFRPLKRLTADTTAGRLLLELIAARVAIYSPHTAFDSAQEGINQRLATGLGLLDIEPVMPMEEGLGAGRHGHLKAPLPLGELAERVKGFLSVAGLHLVGDPQRPVRRVAIACGSAGEFLQPALHLGCDCLLTGEARFHTALEAEATDIGLLLAGHYATERFALDDLAGVLADEFGDLKVWASRREADPLRWI